VLTFIIVLCLYKLTMAGVVDVAGSGLGVCPSAMRVP
jgi:hypothetical protein